MRAKFKLITPLSVRPSFEVTVLVLFSVEDYGFPFAASSQQATKFFCSSGEVRLNPPGPSTTIWSIALPAQEVRDDECGTVGGMRIGKGNRSTRRKPALVPL
jgi:hypothetical protein